MPRHIYALLVGIDAYAPPVLPLNGCVNDIQAVQDYLAGRLAPEGYQLHIHTLLNHEATRQAIIDGFRHHLCQAGGDDVAFFYYAGHGSQEEAPEAFWPLEPDRLDETLVCYDSRSPGGWDLADKELAKLIAEVAQQEPHVAIILDCCHSGSGTRGEVAGVTAVRQAPIDRRQRPLASFLCSVEEAEHLSGSRSPEANPTGWSFPRGRHVCLAACRDSELAKEYSSGGQPRGAFSYFLLDTLHKANGSLTYRDVFKRTDALVRAQVTAQSPQIEATTLSDLDQPFLGGVIAERPASFTVSWHRDHGWTLDGGAIHGIPAPSGDQTTVLALFPFDSPAARLRQVATAIGTTEVLTVMTHLSHVRLHDVAGVQTAMTFKAVITSLPLPPKGVLVEGEEEGIALVRAALRAAGPAQQRSLYVQEVPTPEAAEFRLLARAGHYLIARPADDRPLVTSIQGYTSATASQAIQRLEHIARWTTIAELSSPATSRLRPDAVQLVLYQDGHELRQAQIRLEYHQDRGQWKRPAFKVKLTNTSSEPVYCALLDLTDRYAVQAPFLAGGGVWLGPGEEAWAHGGKDLYAEVAEELWQHGITESKDVLKLIVSTAAFDATLLEQGPLDVQARAMRSAGRGRGTLNRLMHRVHSRDVSATPEEDPYDDWVTSQVVIMTVRPQEEAPIPSRGTPLALGAGVLVHAHPRLQARARLTTVTQSVRDVGPHLLPPLLRAEHEGIQPWQFTASRGTDPGLSALELTQVADPSVVTRSEPLTLLVDRPLGEDEQLVPIGYDGEFFLPLGYAHRTASGGTEILLERLPAPVSEGKRSLGGSIRIFFHKVVSQQLGLAFPYPVLAVAEVSAEETVRYTGDIDQVRARVAQAETIVLYLHGIIGDTQSLVTSVRRATLEVEGQARALADCYDLVLTFDYENLNTSIEDNARLLKQRLAAVGLGANHGKVLHLIAHSMGGLVARWFIERDGGHQVVQHLIMLGTPNAGSPWSTVHDWALTVLTLGLNHLADTTWPGPVVGLLLQAISRPVKAIDAVHVSLEQMQPASAFLRTLASSADPGIPYTILAGNTSIRAAARAGEAPPQPGLLQRLLHTLWGTAVAMPFLGQPNDIAATVTSITSISRARSPQPRLQEVGCDHLVYFSHPEGLQALAAAVKHAQGAAQHPANH